MPQNASGRDDGEPSTNAKCRSMIHSGGRADPAKTRVTIGRNAAASFVPQRNYIRAPQRPQRLAEIACGKQHVSRVFCREQNDVHRTRELPMLKSIVEQVHRRRAVGACSTAIRLGHAAGHQPFARHIHRACKPLRDQQRLITNVVHVKVRLHTQAEA